MSLTMKSKPIEAHTPQTVRGIATTRKPAERQKSKRVDEQEPVLAIIAQWQREKPEFDTGPMALFGALARAFLLTSPVIEKFIDRKSTRLNFSHLVISYAVFCLK